MTQPFLIIIRYLLVAVIIVAVPAQSFSMEEKPVASASWINTAKKNKAKILCAAILSLIVATYSQMDTTQNAMYAAITPVNNYTWIDAAQESYHLLDLLDNENPGNPSATQKFYNDLFNFLYFQAKQTFQNFHFPFGRLSKHRFSNFKKHPYNNLSSLYNANLL